MGINAELKQQGMALLVMLFLAIAAVLAMVILNQFQLILEAIPGLGVANSTDGILTVNETASTTIVLFVAAFALFGSFAAITALVIIVKAIIGVVKDLQ